MRTAGPLTTSTAHPEDDHSCDIRDAADRAEPSVRAAVMPSRELHYEGNDDRGDHGQAGRCGGVDVDLREALVTAVAAEAPDGLAPATEQKQRPGARHDRERDKSAAGVAADPLRGERDQAQGDREPREEPFRLRDPDTCRPSDVHRTSPLQCDRSTGQGRAQAAATAYIAPARSS